MKNLMRRLVVKLGRAARSTQTFQSIWCDLDVVNRLIQVNLSTALLHQSTFPRFKGIYAGQDVVVVATGPSLKQYKPIANCISIGVNHAFLDDRLKLDYLLTYDYSAVKDVITQMNDYRRGECVKLYGLSTEHIDEVNRVIPEQEAIKAGALRFRTDWAPVPDFKPRFYVDLSSMPLCAFRSSVFPAMQFALWTNPRRIYIVGCDCSAAGHFTEIKRASLDPDDVYVSMTEGWQALKFFAQRYYPETEIISVNPVGLKGLFNDLYQ